MVISVRDACLRKRPVDLPIAHADALRHAAGAPQHAMIYRVVDDEDIIAVRRYSDYVLLGRRQVIDACMYLDCDRVFGA